MRRRAAGRTSGSGRGWRNPPGPCRVARPAQKGAPPFPGFRICRRSIARNSPHGRARRNGCAVPLRAPRGRRRRTLAILRVAAMQTRRCRPSRRRQAAASLRRTESSGTGASTSRETGGSARELAEHFARWEIALQAAAQRAADAGEIQSFGLVDLGKLPLNDRVDLLIERIEIGWGEIESG